jgi:N-methylhydantoinase B/acetone carboxylase alpha subunit
MWELISPFVYLTRKVKANSAGPGRHRGGSSFESLMLVWKTPFWEVQNLGTGKIFSSPGIFGGYPGAAAYIHNVRNNNLFELAAAGEPYPVADGDFEHPALMAIEGDREYLQDDFTTLAPIASGDLYLSVMKGGSGLGDPLLRAPAAVAVDVREEHLLPRFAFDVYGVVVDEAAVTDAVAAPDPLATLDLEATETRRREMHSQRLARAVPTREWIAAERERIIAGELIQPLLDMYAESMKLSPRWAAEYRGFWDLDEGFEFERAVTPTVAIEHAKPGRVTPEETVAGFLAACRAAPKPEPLVSGSTAGRALEPETLAALYDERLARREVREIQSGYKNPDRFDQWLALLQSRAGYEERILLPAGEGLNIVAVEGGDPVVRCDCGHDFCDWRANWKLDAVVHVRKTDAALREVYPQMAHCDPEWMELREYYCPSCARQLEVEALPPGYPVVHEFLPDLEGFYHDWLGRELE